MKNYTDPFKPQRVTAEEMDAIIETRLPRGLFYFMLSDGIYVGCDNQAGDAWLEELNTKRSCLKWLNGKEEN